jgi:hypothetical protein
VRPLRTALAATFAALIVPSALLAQQPITTHLPPVHQRPPHVGPTVPSHGHQPNRPGRPNRNPYNTGVLIDGSLANQYLRTPVPAAAPTRKPTPRPKGAPDVFEEHSTDSQ